jgi:putative ABC transport system permease protein
MNKDRKKKWAGSAELTESIRMAMGNLRNNKGRSGLVILGVALGVTTLMAMVSIIEGLKGRLESEIMSTDTTQIYVTRFSPFEDRGDRGENPMLNIADAEAIMDNCPSVKLVDVLTDFGTVAKHGSEKSNLMKIIGATTLYQDVNNDYVDEGRFFSTVEFAAARDVCVISREAAKALFKEGDPIGKRIRVDEQQDFTVVGILANRESIFGSLGQNYIITPLTTLTKHFPSIDELVLIAVPHGNDVLEQAEEEMEGLLRIRHKLPPGKENDFYISTQDQVLDFTRQVTGPLSLVGVVLASIGLMVGGIGVITIMLVSVKERTREIGIRMAVGGTRRAIRQLFLVEAATLTSLGGILGVVVGLLLGWILHLAFHLPATVPVAYIIGAVGFSAGTGIFFGLYPAIQASRLDPIEALSYE